MTTDYFKTSFSRTEDDIEQEVKNRKIENMVVLLFCFKWGGKKTEQHQKGDKKIPRVIGLWFSGRALGRMLKVLDLMFGAEKKN